MKKHDNVKKPILLLGAYGRGNAGDDVFLHSALELFKDRDVYINSADDSLLPKQFQGKVKTISTVSPRDVFKKSRCILESVKLFIGAAICGLSYMAHECHGSCYTK